MPTLTGSIRDLGIDNLDERGVVEWTLQTNAPDGFFDGTDLHLDSRQGRVIGGALVVENIVSSATIEGLSYRLLLNYPTRDPGGKRGRDTWDSKWFQITADSTLQQVASIATPQPVDIQTVQQAIDDAVEGAIADVEQAVTDAQTASGSAAGSATAAAGSASMAATSAGDAAASASAAAASATAAETARTGAESARDDAQQAASEATDPLLAHSKGAWDPGVAYGAADLVSYAGSTYQRLVGGTTAATPDTDPTNWAIFARAGLDGTGSVSSVAGISPDGTGNVPLDAAAVHALPDTYVPAWTDVTGKPTTFPPSAHTHTEADVTGLTADLAAKVASSSVGAANGVAPLDSGSKVPSTYLPSYVDDVLDFANLAAFPATGEAGKIYIADDTNKEYRWNTGTSAYIELIKAPGSTDSLAEGSVNLYYTDARAVAAVQAAGIGGMTAADRVLVSWAQNDNVINTATANVGAMLNSLRQQDGLASNATLAGCATFAAVLASSTAWAAVIASTTAFGSIAASTAALGSVATTSAARLAVEGSSTAIASLATAPGVTTVNTGVLTSTKTVVVARPAWVVSFTRNFSTGSGFTTFIDDTYSSGSVSFPDASAVPNQPVSKFASDVAWHWSSSGSANPAMSIKYIPC